MLHVLDPFGYVYKTHFPTSSYPRDGHFACKPIPQLSVKCYIHVIVSLNLCDKIRDPCMNLYTYPVHAFSYSDLPSVPF